MTDLTIIIPIYNGEKHINRCLSCIPQKTNMKLEIIMVDDFSKDRSLELMKNASNIDPRIHIIFFKENKGVSIARNTALDKALGKYVFFLDVDDTFDFSGVETLYEMAVDGNLDVAIGYRREYIEKTRQYRPYKIKTKDSGILSGDNFFLLSVNDRFQGIGPWQNLYRIDFLQSNNLRYQNHLIHEDNEIFPRIHQKSQKVRFVNLPFYNHHIRNGSLSNSSDFHNVTLNRAKILESHMTLSDPSNSHEFETALSCLMGYNVTRWAESYARITDPAIRKEIVRNMDRWKIFKSCLKSPRFRYRVRAFLLLTCPDTLKFFVHPSKRNC